MKLSVQRRGSGAFGASNFPNDPATSKMQLAKSIKKAGNSGLALEFGHGEIQFFSMIFCHCLINQIGFTNISNVFAQNLSIP